MTTDPSTATPIVTASSTTTIASAVRLADPVSSAARLRGRHRLGRDGDPRQQRRSRADPGDQRFTVPPDRDHRPVRSGPARRSHPVVSAGGQPGRLTGRVDAPDLQHHRIEPGQAHHQHRDQRGDGERRLDGDRTAVAGQTLVVSARLMIFDRALTIESPVTTVYRIAPNAAAAMVPMAYSTVLIPDSSTTASMSRARISRIMLPTIMFPFHHKPDHITSPASPATTGTMPRQMNAGR